MNEVKLDVIAINKNETYPTKEEIWHYRNNSFADREKIIEYMLMEINNKFYEFDCVIILEKGKVLDILFGEKDCILHD